MGFHRSRALAAVVAVLLCCSCTAKKAPSAERATTQKVAIAGGAEGPDRGQQVEPAPAPVQEIPREAPAGPGNLSVLIAKAQETLRILSDRKLDTTQNEQRETGAAFLDQARTASSAGDPARAEMLVNKCLLLLEDLEGQTR
jgi:hypothetical protein